MKRGLSLFLCLLFACLPTAGITAQAHATPRLMVEGVSPYGLYPGHVAGRVFCDAAETFDPTDFKVAVYVFTTTAGDDANGYIKPTYAEPFTDLGADGTFLTLFTTDHYAADNDRLLLSLRVLLLPWDATLGATCSQTQAQAVDALTITRTQSGLYSVAYDCGFAAPTAFPGTQLFWADEFDGDALNPDHWNYDVGFGDNGWGNLETQYYTPDNATVENGVLSLTARYFPQGIDTEEGQAHYTSARLNTRDQFSFQYGRIDIMARCDSGASLWPALWMLPQEEAEWPQGGEIDLWEARGNDPTAYWNSIQFSNHGWDTVSNNGKGGYPSGDLSAWNLYSLEWTASSLRWYLNGQLTFGATGWVSDAGAFPAPFDQPFYLLMNLAVGGWFNLHEEESAEPDPATFATGDQRLQVDYVRVYRMGVMP